MFVLCFKSELLLYVTYTRLALAYFIHMA